MKTILPLSASILAVSLLIASSLHAGPFIGHKQVTPATEYTPPLDTRQAAWLKKVVETYPLSTCVVSGEKLQDDGDGCVAFNHVFRSAKHPDRLVRLCCQCCVADFKNDPYRYLNKINEAEARR